MNGEFGTLQEYRLTASAQELGGEMIFKTRVGFSGTPSNLLPEEMKPCHYEQGDDGRMIYYLTQVLISSCAVLDAIHSNLLIILQDS